MTYGARIQRHTEQVGSKKAGEMEEWVQKNQEYLARLIQMQGEVEEKGIVHKSGSMRET